ncbi:MAG TPA: hypothetical protein VGX27_08030 [Candidatus Dormibacteraeota bacterium]|nr:hypothetical protein [Candidatus Dormibacteraeota bacterium]
MVEPKDVVIAILGASAALGGFTLVFLGIVITSYESYSGGVADQVIQPYRRSGTVLLGVFAICLITVALSLLWLINGGSVGLYDATIALFALELVVVFGGAVVATRMVLWR